MASLPHPPLPLEANDKVLHALGFTVLAGLVALAYPRTSLVSLWLGLAVFGALIEAVQAIPVFGHTASLEDWFADIVSASVVLAIIGAVRWTRKPPSKA